MPVLQVYAFHNYLQIGTSKRVVRQVLKHEVGVTFVFTV